MLRRDYLTVQEMVTTNSIVSTTNFSMYYHKVVTHRIQVRLMYFLSVNTQFDSFVVEVVVVHDVPQFIFSFVENNDGLPLSVIYPFF
jgi:hypothetical protein